MWRANSTESSIGVASGIWLISLGREACVPEPVPEVFSKPMLEPVPEGIDAMPKPIRRKPTVTDKVPIARTEVEGRSAITAQR